MGYGDWIFLAVLLIVAGLGAMLGFGKVLKFVTGGIIGVFISVLLCYCFGGMILDLPFVNQMLADLASHWSHIAILSAIHLEIIIYYIALFIITTIIRIIIVHIIKGLVETNMLLMRILNKLLGAVLLVGLMFILMGLVFQIIGWIGGTTEANFRATLAQNAGAIVRHLYDWNPMKSLTEFVSHIGK